MNGLAGSGGAILFAVLGLIGGSFASAASHRLPRREPIGMDRSRCPACGHVLGAAELVPLASWLAQRGRCRHCGAAISWRYPAVELATAALFAGAWWLGAGDVAFSALLALTALGLVIVTVADLEAGIIPDAVLVALLPVALLWRWHLGGDWLDGAAGAVIGLAGLFAIRAGFKALRGYDALGLGDVKFMGLAGIYVGVEGLAAMLLLGGVIGILFGVAWRLSGREPAFPLGPSLCVALLLCLGFPDQIARLGLAPP